MSTEPFDEVANYLLSLPPECWRPGVRGRARAAIRCALQNPNRPKLWDPGFLGELRNIGCGTVAEVDRQAKARRAVRAVAPLALPPRHEVALALLTAMISAGRADDDLIDEALDAADDFLRLARERAKDDAEDAEGARRASARRGASPPA